MTIDQVTGPPPARQRPPDPRPAGRPAPGPRPVGGPAPGPRPVGGPAPGPRPVGGPAPGPLSVGQLAARAGVRTDTVRYYERTGLLPRPRRTDGDHRRYGAADLDRLLFIRGAQRLGLRLAEVRDLLAVRDTGVCPCEPAEALLHRHVAEIDRELARLTGLRAQLTGMLAAMRGPDCPDPAPGTWCAPACEGEGGGDHDVLVLR